MTGPRVTYPSGGSLLARDKDGRPVFAYTPAATTDIRARFAAIRAEQAKPKTKTPKALRVVGR